ncbi:MAG: hypothetical protein ACK8QZ_08400, partial [Anaerolineales bacterium]
QPAAPAAPAEELPDWLKGIAEETPAAAQPAAPAQPTSGWEALGTLGTSAQEQDEALAWLESLAARHGAKPEELVTPPEARREQPPEWVEAARQVTPPPSAETPAAPAAPTEELPDWLKGIAEETPAAAQPAELPDWLKTASVESGMDETAAWLRSLETPSPLQPGAEPAMKGARVAGEEETPPVTPPPSLDWKPVETAPAAPSAPAPPPLKRTGSLSPTRDLHLAQAQMALERGDIRQAVEHYSRLIRKGRLLDEVIFDLREALYRYPVDVLLWQTLGDAYLRANRLREALDAYTKAGQLLR